MFDKTQKLRIDHGDRGKAKKCFEISLTRSLTTLFGHVLRLIVQPAHIFHKKVIFAQKTSFFLHCLQICKQLGEAIENFVQDCTIILCGFTFKKGENMKNRFVLLIVLAALIFSLALPASNVQAAGKTATLVDLRFVPFKGWAVVFKVAGDWQPDDLKGNTLSVGGQTMKLYCNFRDGDHVSCTMESLGQFVGKTATIFFGGQIFSAIVPPKYAKAGEVCLGYSFETVEEWYYIFEDLDVGTAAVSEWWGETVIPETIDCVTKPWTPNNSGDGIDYYMEYRGEGEGEDEIPQ